MKDSYIDSHIISILPLIFFIYLVIILSKEKVGILNCSFTKLIENRYIYLILTFVSVFTYLKTLIKKDNFFDTFKKSLLVFIIFIITTKSDGVYTLIFLGLIGIMFIVEKYMIEDPEFDLISNKDLQYIKNVIYVVALCILLIGFVRFFFKKRKQYKSKFSWNTFLLGSYKCKK